MTATQRAVLGILRSHCFRGPQTCVSQQLIADELGIQRETVNRACKALGEQGHLTIAKQRRAGSKWEHNVYRLRDWNPVMRAHALNHMARVRRAKAAPDHTERTARPSRAQTTPRALPCPQCRYYQRCGRASAATRIHERTAVCDTCTNLKAQVASFVEENEKLTNQLSGYMATQRRDAGTIGSLTAELRKRDIEDPANADVQCVLDNWVHHCRSITRKGRQPVIDPGSKRWTIARKALKRHSVAECLEAIEGLALLPYVTDRGRTATGRPSQRYDDIEYALKDETTVERCRKYRARVLGASADMLFEASQAASATACLYSTAFLTKLGRERFDAMPREEQIAHRVRVARVLYGDGESNVVPIRRDAA